MLQMKKETHLCEFLANPLFGSTKGEGHSVLFPDFFAPPRLRVRFTLVLTSLGTFGRRVGWIDSPSNGRDQVTRVEGIGLRRPLGRCRDHQASLAPQLASGISINRAEDGRNHAVLHVEIISVGVSQKRSFSHRYAAHAGRTDRSRGPLVSNAGPRATPPSSTSAACC